MNPSSINFKECIEPAARLLLNEPNPHHTKPGKELRWGQHGSLSVDLSKGTWHDHEAGEGGGVLDLIRRETGKEGKDAIEWLKDQGILSSVNDAAPAIPKPRPKLVKTYNYVDEAGELISQVCRYEPKTFKQRKPNGQGGWNWSVKDTRQVPYNLPTLIHAEPNEIVFICEGEKDADNLIAAGLVATCNAGGANKWNDSLIPFFEGRNVVILPDNDEAGRKHISLVASKLQGVAASVKVLELSQYWPEIPHKGDVTNWLDAGHTGPQLIELAAAAPTLQEIVPANDTSNFTPLNAPLNPHGFPHLSEKGKPLNTWENLAYLLDQYGIRVRYNVISKKTEVLIPGHASSIDNKQKATLAEITSLCARNSMPKTEIAQYLVIIGDRNQYNPVLSWINSRQWDGVSRFEALAATIVPEEGYPLEMRDILLKRWLISAVAGASNTGGFESHGALVLVGAQGTGKTTWFNHLVCSELRRELVLTGALLDTENKDTIITAVSHWIVELGELDATFRKADIAKLKAFITQGVDKFRRPFEREDDERDRRTVFCASVNSSDYLVDDSGNRRWWTLPVKSIDYMHDVDMQQLWSEVLTWFKSGERWHLTGEEQERLNAINQGHEQIDPIAEKIREVCTSPDAKVKGQEWMIPGDVLAALGYRTPNKTQRNIAAKALQDLALETRVRHKVKQYLVPGGLKTNSYGLDQDRPF